MIRVSIHRLYRERSNIPPDEPFFLFDDSSGIILPKTWENPVL